MSSNESSTSADEFSSSESLASSPLNEHSRRRRRTRGTATPPKSESLLSTTVPAGNEVRGSMEDGGGEPLAQPSDGTSKGGRARGRLVAQPIYHPQTCRLCKRETLPDQIRAFRPRDCPPRTLVQCQTRPVHPNL